MANEPGVKPEGAKGQGPEWGKEALRVAKEAGAAAVEGAKEALALAKGLDLRTVVEQIKAQIGPPGFVELAKATFADPAGFYAKVKPEEPHKAVAFLLIMVAATAILTFLGGVLHLMIGSAILSLVLTVVLVPIGTVVAALVIHVLLKLFGANGTFADTFKIGCYVSWMGVIGAFPLWGFLGAPLHVLISCACLAVSAYLWIQGAVHLHEMPMKKAAIPIGGLAGLLILISLLTASAALRAAEKMNHEAGKSAPVAQAPSGTAAPTAAPEAPKVETPKVETPKPATGGDATKVAEAINKLRNAQPDDLNAVHRAIRELDGKLQGADFSGIKVKNVELRGLDLTGAKFDGSVCEGWKFTEYSGKATKLDGASFKGCTFIACDFGKASLVKADFTGSTAKSQDQYPGLNLYEARCQGADFSGLKFEGKNDGLAVSAQSADLTGANFANAQINNIDLNKAKLTGADFSGATMQNAIFGACIMPGVNFSGANLAGVKIESLMSLTVQFQPGLSPQCQTEGCNFSKAQLPGTNLERRIFRFCNFDGANFVNANLASSEMVGSSFKGADLAGANLSRADLRATNFEGAKLDGANLDHAFCQCANLKDASLKDLKGKPNTQGSLAVPPSPEGKKNDLVQQLVEGKTKAAVGQNLAGVDFRRARLTDIDFSQASLAGAVFDYAILGNCKFKGADLTGASFQFATFAGKDCDCEGGKFAGANFFGADLAEAKFVKTDFTKAKLSYACCGTHTDSAGYPKWNGADLSGADFSNALLRYDNVPEMSETDGIVLAEAVVKGANFENASMVATNVTGADLSGSNFKGAHLGGIYADWDTNFENAEFAGATFEYGFLVKGKKVTDGSTSLVKAKLAGACFAHFHFTADSILKGADFSNGEFAWARSDPEKKSPGTGFSNLDLTGARFVKADLEKCRFSNCIMNGADLSEANLKGSRWEASNNTRTEGIKKTEDEMYRGITFKGANLSNADVYHMDFTGSDFTGAILDGARTENAKGLPGK